jgi:hypothetical protein
MAIRGIDFKWLVTLLSLSLTLSFQYYYFSLISIFIQSNSLFLSFQVRWIFPFHARHQCVSFFNSPNLFFLLSFHIFNCHICILDSSTYRVIVAINWKRYHSCTYPLHIWIVVGHFLYSSQ